MIGVKKIKKGQIESYTTADVADSVGKRYQTDNQQTYNDATSSIQTQLNTKLASTSWIDYSATSTIVGWSSFTSKFIFYKIIDNYCFVDFYISGTSNTTTINFTLPFNNTSSFATFAPSGYSANNNVNNSAPSRLTIENASNVVNCYKDMAFLNWTASSIKAIAGQISFKIN